jgi:oligopeptide transport system ATP-binding protein
METSSHLLEVNDLAVSFFTYAGEVQAVRGISWYLNKNETIALVGESGCGKSVTIQTVMGLLQSPGRVTGGSVRFEERDMLGLSAKELRQLQGNRMTMIFQDPLSYLNPTMRVGEQIAESYRLHHKVSRSEAEARVLDMMHLISFPEPERNMYAYPHQLSGGMRQRIMVAMALICNPQVLFADEPTTALDVTIQAQIIELMNSLKEKLNTAIVLITHDLGVVANMAQRIYVMYAGKIVERGSAKDIFYRPKHPYTWGLLASVPRLDADQSRDFRYIPGTPPDLLNPPKGCPFAARCRYACRACVSSMPEEMAFDSEDHRASCWLYHPGAEALLAAAERERGMQR